MRVAGFGWIGGWEGCGGFVSGGWEFGNVYMASFSKL